MKNEAYLNLAPTPHTICEGAREALSLIPEKTDQELYFPAEPEAEEPQEEEEEPVVEPTYTAVTEIEGKNPKTEGWYEKVGEDYVLTTDEEPVEEKIYYVKN
jgi:hypothetical protein